MFWKRERKNVQEKFDMPQQLLKVDLQNLINAMLRQYKSRYVVIREAIQNSIDAGAKHVKITINDREIRVDDDGVGMDLNDISDYWNTLCRTSKKRKKGAIGEFGLGRLTLLLMSDKMLMETNKKGKSYRVTTDRTGTIQIENGNRKDKGTCVWVNGDFSSIKDEFIGYAQIVAKTRPEDVRLSGVKISQQGYAPKCETVFTMNINELGIKGCIWIPSEAIRQKGKKKEREAAISVYVNDLFVKNLTTDYYVFGEVNCNDLRLVTSRDDVADDRHYEEFYSKLVNLIETKFYPQIASNSALVNDARIKNDILLASSKLDDKRLIEKMVFETTSGEKVTGEEILSSPKVFVASETNPRDMELGDNNHHIGEGMSIIAPTGLKRILDKTIRTVDRSEVMVVVREKLGGTPATAKERAEFLKVGKLITSICGRGVDFRTGMQATAQYDPDTGRITINIEAGVFRDVKTYIEKGRKDLAMIRLIGTVAHEVSHGKIKRDAEVHDVEFYKVFENMVHEMENRVIEILKRAKSTSLTYEESESAVSNQSAMLGEDEILQTPSTLASEISTSTISEAIARLDSNNKTERYKSISVLEQMFYVPLPSNEKDYYPALPAMHQSSSKLKKCIENIKEELRASTDEITRLLLLESLLRAKRTFLEFIAGEYVSAESLRCRLCGRVFKRRGINNHLVRTHPEIWKRIRPYTDEVERHLREKDETGLSSKEWERQLLEKYQSMYTKRSSTMRSGSDRTLFLEGRAFDLEKEGELDEAKRLYWQIINDGFNGSFPYERLRIICAKQKDWRGAIKACQAYVSLDASYMGYDVKKERMKEWIRKYREKLGITSSYD